MNLSGLQVIRIRNFKGGAPNNIGDCRKGKALPHIGRHRRKFRRRLLAVCCLLFAVCSSTAFASSGSWIRQRTSNLAWLHAVFFLDENHGWAGGSRGTLLSTTDGGKSWEPKSRPTEDAIRDIYFSDGANGWLVCERNIHELASNDEPRAYLMKTSDGGEHWKRVNMRGADVDARLMRAIFSRGGRGWAFGEGGAIYTTHDSGANWIRLQAPTRYLLLGGTFIDENSGWLVGAGATILQTSDGGETWQHARLPAATDIRINSASFVDARLGWAVGSAGAIYRTINGGRTWQLQRSGVSADLLDVKFLDALEGWAVGAEGTVLHTTSGGLYWTVEQSGTPHALERIFFADRTHGWAVGFGGTIITYGRAEAPRLRR
jgi:photosystem II stability/assembly factor-like uncharacterized protein